MQIFDFSPNGGQPSTQGTFKKLSNVIKYGAEWTAEMAAQVRAMDLLGRYLDDRYCLLRNLTLPDLDVPIPFILIGPPGIQMIYVTPVRGIYRARGDLWFVVDSRRKFRPAAPNLIIRSTLMARAIEVYLERHGFAPSKVEPVLVSTESGLYIEAIRPTVRIVMSDAIDRYIAGLQSGELLLTKPDVEKAVELLTTHPQEAVPVVTQQTAAVEPYVPEQPSEETPEWVEDRIAALDKNLEEPEPEEPDASVPVADAQTISEVKAEWGPERAESAQPAPEPVLAETVPPVPVEAEPALLGAETPAEAVPAPAEAAGGRRSIFTRGQWIVLIIMTVMILAVLGAFAALIAANY